MTNNLPSSHGNQSLWGKWLTEQAVTPKGLNCIFRYIQGTWPLPAKPWTPNPPALMIVVSCALYIVSTYLVHSLAEKNLPAGKHLVFPYITVLIGSIVMGFFLYRQWLKGRKAHFDAVIGLLSPFPPLLIVVLSFAGDFFEYLLACKKRWKNSKKSEERDE